jgi:hypothetical protein
MASCTRFVLASMTSVSGLPCISLLDVRVVFHYALINVNLNDAGFDALAEDLLVERVPAVGDEEHTIACDLIDRLKAVVLEFDPLGATRSHGYCQRLV